MSQHTTARTRFTLLAAGTLSLAAALAASGASGLAAAPAPAGAGTQGNELRAMLRAAGTLPTTERYSIIGGGGGESAALRTQADQYAQARLAPGLVDGGAASAAFASVLALPQSGTATEQSTLPYNSDDLRYRDPAASNSQGGSGLVSGRITGLALEKSGHFVFAGGADGGVFRGVLGMGGAVTSWTPISDALPTLSTGDLEYDAATDTLWYATGEGNTGSTSFTGTGVYRMSGASLPGSVFTPASQIGGTELAGTTISKLRFDGHGQVFAATSRGLWSHSVSGAEGWVFRFAPNPAYLPGGSLANDPSAYIQNIVNDLAITPDGTGNHMVASMAWRGGAAYNGFYISNNGGSHWNKVDPKGDLNANEIGRATFAYSADGSQLYTVLESTILYNTPGVNSYLAGVYVSKHGKVNGPWTKVASSVTLENSGSALNRSLSPGYGPGIQSWYNQFLKVDPANPNHLWLGLEEVYESTDAGQTWHTIGPYWNFSFGCWSVDPASNTCSNTTHSDQHSIAIGGGRVYVGNDGGIYSRPVNGTLDANGHAADWRDLNSGLDTLQYYSVATGTGPSTADGSPIVSMITGGLQDNGQSLQLGDDTQAGSPFGGDGGDSLMDPRPGQGCNMVAEYVFLAMSVTNNCARSDGTVESVRSIDPGDPNARFIAPFTADVTNPDSWLAGGQYVWTQGAGYAITNGHGWTKAFDVGSGHSITAVALQNGIGYVTWCGPCNPASFTRGMATNYGGTWHQLTVTSLPNRYLAGVTISPTDASGKTAFAVVNGYSRRFATGPGAGTGHLYKTTDGGATWTNASIALPDVPSDSLVIKGSTWYLGTDLGVLTSADGGASWKRVTGFPAVTVMQVQLGPDGSVYAGTHGRGLWKVSD